MSVLILADNSQPPMAIRFDTDGVAGDQAETASFIPAFAGASKSFTIESWFKLNALPPSNVGYFFQFAEMFTICLDVVGNIISCTKPNNTIAVSGINTAQAIPSDGVARHFAFVFEINGVISYFLTAYRNGVIIFPRTEKVIASGGTGVASKFMLGRNSVAGFIGGQANNTMLCEYDEVRIWDKVLTQEEIISRMNKRITLPQTNLLSCWGMDFKLNNAMHDSAIYPHVLTATEGTAMIDRLF